MLRLFWNWRRYCRLNFIFWYNFVTTAIWLRTAKQHWSGVALALIVHCNWIYCHNRISHWLTNPISGNIARGLGLEISSYAWYFRLIHITLHSDHVGYRSSSMSNGFLINYNKTFEVICFLLNCYIGGYSIPNFDSRELTQCGSKKAYICRLVIPVQRWVDKCHLIRQGMWPSSLSLRVSYFQQWITPLVCITFCNETSVVI